MDKLIIQGSHPLQGEIQIGGAKNAALPILISSLLTSQPCHYGNVPVLQDIRMTLSLLSQLGVKTQFNETTHEVGLQADQILSQEAPYDLVRKMRASVVVLGPLLARFGKAKVSLPGGCAIGARPINYHLSGLEKLGAKITLEGGYVLAEAKKLTGAHVNFEFPSVGATENLMMAAVLAQGESVLENCAKEPEITDLANALRSMGAEIEGDGTRIIRIQGKSELQGCTHEMIPDRIEAGTYLAAAFATGGKIKLTHIHPSLFESVLLKLEEAGARIQRGADSVTLQSQGRPRGVDLSTQPFPGFPTDMQAQFMAVMTVADGASLITESIFENRFMHVPELMRLGADIRIQGNSALIRGKKSLKGAPLMATDLRASASLVIGALAAEGESVINRIYHLDRGYEKMEEKLRSLGAKIQRV